VPGSTPNPTRFVFLFMRFHLTLAPYEVPLNCLGGILTSKLVTLGTGIRVLVSCLKQVQSPIAELTALVLD
jgi:hypothetical protein